MSSKASVLHALRSKIQGIQRNAVESPRSYVTSSFPELDRALPGGGLPLGTFVEVLTERDGSRALLLTLKCARMAVAQHPMWAVVDTGHSFYPQAAAQSGFNIDNLIVVQPEPLRAAWAFAQILLSKDIGACFWSSNSMDNMVFRRLQLAAERGGGLGFVIRPMTALRKPCWGSLRLHVISCTSNKVSLRLLHARGQPNLSRDEIEVTL